MSSISNIRQADLLRHIDHGVALTLVQAIHRHLDPEAVVQVLWSQAATLTRATGLRYLHPAQDLDFAFGDGRHCGSYTLNHQGEDLGELELRFQRRVDETVLETVEELITLVMPALKNALAYHQACALAARAEHARSVATSRARPLPPGTGEAATRAPDAAPASGSPWDDSLVLVCLDGFDDIRTAHGEVWAQTLVQTIQNQIHEGLRDADSVFQIDEGLLAVLLPRTSEDAAIDVAGKIRVLIAGLHLRDGRITRQLSACMGVVGARDAGRPEDVLDQARTALAQARQEGRSTIRAYRAEA